jgi:hypothetical protein
MTRRAIKPGTKFKDVFTSKFINELTQPDKPNLGGAGFGFSSQNLWIRGVPFFNLGGDVIDTYDPVIIVGHGVSTRYNPAENYNTLGSSPEIVPEPYVKVTALADWTYLDSSDNPTWGIALDRITPETGPGRILLTGISYLKLLNNPPTTNTFAYSGIDIRRGQMIYGVTGRAEIIGNLRSNESHTLVNLSKRTQSAVTGITVNNIQPNQAGFVNIDAPAGNQDGLSTGGTYQGACWNPHRTKAVLANRRVVAVDVAGRLVIVFEECP